MADETEVKPEVENNINKVDEILVRTSPKLFRNIPKAQRQEMVKAVVSVTKIHSGPLPPFEVIEGYEQIYPGSAKLIFDAFEKQSNHRIKMEDTVITSQQRQSGRGQHYALIIALAFLGVAALCILQGHDIAGSILGSFDVLAIVTVFITGRNKQIANLREKQQSLQQPKSKK